jgi:hypothetical protein
MDGAWYLAVALGLLIA